MESERLFYHLYDLKKEEIPGEEKWDLRMEQMEIVPWQSPVEKGGQQTSGQHLSGQPSRHHNRHLPSRQQSSEEERSARMELESDNRREPEPLIPSGDQPSGQESEVELTRVRGEQESRLGATENVQSTKHEL